MGLADVGIRKSDHRIVYDIEDRALGLKRKTRAKNVFHEKLCSKPCEEYGRNSKVLKNVPKNAGNVLKVTKCGREPCIFAQLNLKNEFFLCLFVKCSAFFTDLD